MEFKNPIHFYSEHKPSFSHLDPWGHINTQYYIEYIINHRFECIERYLGLNLAKLAELSVVFPIVELQLSFLASMFPGQTYKFHSFVSEVDIQTCKVNVDIFDSVKNRCILQGAITLACVDKYTFKKINWPDGTIARFFEG